MKRNPRSFWEKLVAEVETGSPAVAVAKRYGVKCGTLKWWRYHLKARPRPASDSEFLPVVVHQEHGPAGGVVEVLIRDVVVRVATGTDPRYVAALAGALLEC